MSNFNGREDLRISGHHIRQLKSKITGNGSKIAILSSHRNEADSKRIEIEGPHIQWVLPNTRNSVSYATVLIGIIAVYFLDVLLFGPTAEILSEKAFSDLPAMAMFARFSVPAAIISIEIAVAMQIYFCRKDKEDYYKNSSELIVWLMFGILLSLVMPALVVGTNLVQASLETNAAYKTALSWQLLGLVALALAMHLPIIFNGRLAHDAKSYYSFRFKHNALQKVIRRCQNEVAASKNIMRTDFDVFYDQLNRHRQTYQDNFDPGPFDVSTRDALREIYGYEVIAINGNNNQIHHNDVPAVIDSNVDLMIHNNNVDSIQNKESEVTI
jgi:hypothetical protein